MSSREWRCSWSSADRRCSNYIWVIDNFIAYKGASYIRDFTVYIITCDFINMFYTISDLMFSYFRSVLYLPIMPLKFQQKSQDFIFYNWIFHSNRMEFPQKKNTKTHISFQKTLFNIHHRQNRSSGHEDFQFYGRSMGTDVAYPIQHHGWF